MLELPGLISNKLFVTFLREGFNDDQSNWNLWPCKKMSATLELSFITTYVANNVKHAENGLSLVRPSCSVTQTMRSYGNTLPESNRENGHEQRVKSGKITFIAWPKVMHFVANIKQYMVTQVYAYKKGACVFYQWQGAANACTDARAHTHTHTHTHKQLAVTGVYNGSTNLQTLLSWSEC